ncbi:MAG TPA: zf-HC2 domain-containing protein [Pyrinomonadaceae bacterium]|nr:zf-HC2 domain-containing protein [Pyrinomonadaceae bacterium]
MNHDSDIEMDNLLRRHLRRSAKSVAGIKDAGAKLDATRESAAHMDADELNAYVEGALPDAARSRYTLHLAECDSCRKIATELVISYASPVAEESSSVLQTVDAPRRSWREWFAALLSPPVLRYAAPALAVFAFAAIVFVVMTRNREVTSFVTQNEQNRQKSANPVTAEPKDGTATGAAATSDNRDNHGANSNTNSNSVMQNPVAPPAQSPQKEVPVAMPSAQTDGVSPADAPKTADVSVEERQQKLNDQERAAETKQPAPPVQSNSPSDKFMDRGKEKDDASLAAQKRRESNEVATGGAASAGPVNGRRSSRTETPSSGTLGTTSESASDDRKKNEATKSAPSSTSRPRRDTAGADEDSTETTRTVAGKRFRQQNGIWIDTSYNSSRQTVKVKRGSEQYRALVADEPIIGTVSNSFGGDVIVVVRGKAYHIY